jgi:hypothetical protein
MPRDTRSSHEATVKLGGGGQVMRRRSGYEGAVNLSGVVRARSGYEATLRFSGRGQALRPRSGYEGAD